MLVNLMVAGAVWGQSSELGSAPPAASAPVAPSSPYSRKYVSKRATMYYTSVWGVDEFSVKYAESGEIIRFSYRVVDPERAEVMIDKKAVPSLIDPQAGVKLVVPELEQVGLLRQTPKGKPEAGKSYWMAFSNAGRRVKKGDRVDVVIGNFRAQGLVVE